MKENKEQINAPDKNIKKKKYWFVAKRSHYDSSKNPIVLILPGDTKESVEKHLGYGRNSYYPISWEGWLLVILWILCLILSIIFYNRGINAGSLVIISTLAFVIICSIKTNY